MKYDCFKKINSRNDTAPDKETEPLTVGLKFQRSTD